MTLPAGRVFFSSSLLSGSKAVGGLGEALGLPDGEALGSEVTESARACSYYSSEEIQKSWFERVGCSRLAVHVRI